MVLVYSEIWGQLKKSTPPPLFPLQWSERYWRSSSVKVKGTICSQTLEDLLRCCRTRRNPGQFCSGLASKSHCSRPPIDACACLQDGDSSVAVAQSGHTMLECCTPVAFVTMPAGSSDSLCYDLRHNMSFDDRIRFPPRCSRVPNTMVPLILAGVDLNTFGFRRVFSFTSPCHWRYCPLSPEARPCQCTKSRVHNTI